MKIMKEMRLMFVLSALFLGVALVGGCGEAKKESAGLPGTTPIEAAATVGIQNCAVCHGSGPQVQDWLTSRHANTNSSPSSTSAFCISCHDKLGDGARMSTAFAGQTNRMVVSCESCHGGGQYHFGSGPLPYPRAHIDRCTECHGIQSSPVHNSLANRIRLIYDTHNDKADTTDIEGYVIDTQDSEACLKCHFNAHKLDVTIPVDWSKSAHGGFLVNVKDTAAGQGGATIDSVAAAAVTSAEAPAWVTYDFKDVATRAQCQRCHTSTGYRNMANAPTTYNAEANTFFATGSQKEMLYCWACHTDKTGSLRSPGQFVRPGYPVGTANVANGSAVVTGNGTNWTTGNTPVGSEFRVSGDTAGYIVLSIDSTTQITLTAAFTGTTASGVAYEISPYIIPAGRGISGLSGSFVCASCHSGRETGDFIKNYPVAISGLHFGTFNSHYLTAGGILYRTIGYEYAGLNYSNPGNFAHDKIGSTAAPNTGTNGPCVECHMTTASPPAGSHLFKPTTRVAGAITAITASTVCNTCHGVGPTAAVSPASLNTLETQYKAALTEFEARIEAQGIYYCKDTYPYFFTDVACPNTFANRYTAWPNKDTLGAAFNLNMLKHMPMAFAHNSLYTRRLIFDSIDFLDNGVLNGTITVAGDAALFLNNGSRP